MSPRFIKPCLAGLFFAWVLLGSFSMERGRISHCPATAGSAITGPAAARRPGWGYEVRPSLAWAQLTSTGPSSQIAPGRKLTAEMVRTELERRLARNPGNEAAIWNAGYDFFRHYPQNQDTAKAISNGFLRARTNDPGQKATLMKGASYWAAVHDYGIANVPAGQNLALTERKYYGRNGKQSVLPRRKAGSAHQGFPPYDWPGRGIEKDEPYYGRPDNPYPGKYYPGMYPP